jgi:transcriptional regulator with XRE-family HTH domain
MKVPPRGSVWRWNSRKGGTSRYEVNQFEDIGRRLKAYRMGKGLTAEAIADELGISRAAVYRIETGGVVKIETLQQLANVLNTTVASLLGAGVEYYASPISYFERMRQLEAEADQVVAHFPPLSFLLTTEAFPHYLKRTLLESLPAGIGGKSAERDIDTVIAILDERRQASRRRRLSVVNFVNLLEIERWLKLGVVGRFDLSGPELAERRKAARAEVEHLITLIESEPMGVQIGLIEEVLPNTSFQLFRTADKTYLGISPFRLGGDLPNIRSGVAMLTADVEPVRLYESLVDDWWKRARKGKEAAELLHTVLARSAIAAPQGRRATAL